MIKITDLGKEINKEIYNIYKIIDKEIKIIGTSIEVLDEQ